MKSVVLEEGCNVKGRGVYKYQVCLRAAEQVTSSTSTDYKIAIWRIGKEIICVWKCECNDYLFVMCLKRLIIPVWREANIIRTFCSSVNREQDRYNCYQHKQRLLSSQSHYICILYPVFCIIEIWPGAKLEYKGDT